MTFYNKYLKYKNKYLNLKEIIQKGGIYIKDDKEMVKIDKNTEYEVSKLKEELEKQGLIGAAAIKKYKGNPNVKDNPSETTGKIGVKTFFKARYTFQELKDGGFNINNFINSSILNSKTTKEVYSLDMNDIKNILSAENNFRKLIDIGFDLDDIAKVITEDSEIKYCLGTYNNPKEDFIKLYKIAKENVEKIKINKKTKNLLLEDLAKIFDTKTLEDFRKFNFTVRDFYYAGKKIYDIIDLFHIANIIDEYYTNIKIDEDFIKFLVEQKYLIDKKYKIEDLFEKKKLREAIKKQYTAKALKLTRDQISKFLHVGFYTPEDLINCYSIPDLWENFPEKKSLFEASFKRETDIIKARIKLKEEYQNTEPTDEEIETIIHATNEKERKELMERIKQRLEKEKRDQEKAIIATIKKQIKANEVKKLRDRGMSIHEIIKIPEYNDIDIILMVFTSKEIIFAKLTQFYRNLRILDLLKYKYDWFVTNWGIFYQDETEYNRSLEFMSSHALPLFLDLINDDISKEQLTKWYSQDLIKKIDMLLEEEIMSKLHPYWEIIQRRMRELEYKTKVPEKWINTATEEKIRLFLEQHP